MKIKYHKKFEKSYNKKSLKLREIFKKKLRIFMQNPFSFELKNHKLKGNLMIYILMIYILMIPYQVRNDIIKTNNG